MDDATFVRRATMIVKAADRIDNESCCTIAHRVERMMGDLVRKREQGGSLTDHFASSP